MGSSDHPPVEGVGIDRMSKKHQHTVYYYCAISGMICAVCDIDLKCLGCRYKYRRTYIRCV